MKRIQFRVEFGEDARSTKVYADGEQVSQVVAVRVQARAGRHDTYLVFRVSDAELVLDGGPPERFEMSVRSIPAFEPRR